MSGILVYSERSSVACELLSFAASTGRPVAVVLCGPDAAAAAAGCFAYGAGAAYTCAGLVPGQASDDALADALSQAVERAGADVVLIGSTLGGRAIAARLAQKLDAGCITDANGLRCESAAGDGGRLKLVATRYALGGNTVATETIKPPSRQVIAVMPQTLEAKPAAVPESGKIEELAPSAMPSAVRLVALQPKQKTGVDIESADVIVCVGRGLAAADELPTVQALADRLGGVVACTRPISHERHWLSEEQMIGISGKTVSPRLYIGIGLSGQIQHVVGIMGSKVTVAVNSDKNAPIFKMVDYGIVGDGGQVMARLLERLAARGR